MFESLIELNKGNPWVVIATFYALINKVFQALMSLEN